MEKPTFAYGHDYGNSDTCGVLAADGPISRQLPSVFAAGSWSEVQRFAASNGRSVSEYLQFGHYVLSYVNDKDQLIEKYIGQKVFDDGLAPVSTSGDQERYWRNNYSLESLMVSSGSATSETIYGLHVVSGLPIHLYSPENAKNVVSALSGSHIFKLNGCERSMTIHSVKVIMEGAGALIAYGSNEPGSLEGVIDVGGETTDLFAARGQRPLSALCDGRSLGVAAAADLFSRKFKEAYGRVVGLDTCSSLLRQHVQRSNLLEVRDSHHASIPAFELADLIQASLDAVGQEIATFVSQKWKDHLHDMSRVLLVGGGAHYFKKSIQERLPFARAVPRPEMANAAGYASLAEAIMQRVQSVEAVG
jgi:hypothetical protein